VKIYLFGCNFLNKPPFWGRSVNWILDLIFGCGSTCWGTIFLISLLSGAGLSVGFLICFLGEGLPLSAGCLICFLGEGLSAGVQVS
jgi:hypothetical protein